MAKNKFYLLITLGVIFITLLIIIIILHNRNTSTTIDKNDLTPNEETIIEENLENQEEFKEIVLLYFSNNSYRFIPKKAELKIMKKKEDMFKNFITLLLNNDVRGLIKPIPEDLSLRTLYFSEKNKRVILDLETKSTFTILQGTKAELEFIYFFVNNLCYNFKDDINKVKILINGNEVKTLAGHINTTDPFFKDFKPTAY